MPGRLSSYDDKSFKDELRRRRGPFRDDIGVLAKQYNIAPTKNIPIYTNTGIYTYAHFGLIPSWAPERKSMQINARSESVYEKSSFKEAYKQRRCLILVNGYFEWMKDPQTKHSQAYFVHAPSHGYFALAGIYESWYDNVLKRPILTVALLTTQPNDKIAQIHDRMPVVLEAEQWNFWLEEGRSYTELNTLFVPLSSEKIDYYPVGISVNSVRNDSPACIEAINEPKQRSLF